MFQSTPITQNILFILLFGVWIYFIVIRPQRQQQKKMKDMMANIKKNDEVVTTSGIHGTVAIVKDKTIVVRVDEGCRIEFDRESIASITNTEAKTEVVK